MKTFGEFFDNIKTQAEETADGESLIILEDWEQSRSAEELVSIRTETLTKRTFFHFSIEIANSYAERLQGICTEALYHHVTQRGHAFLQTIARVGREFGLKIDKNQVDTPLTPSETLTNM